MFPRRDTDNLPSFNLRKFTEGIEITRVKTIIRDHIMMHSEGVQPENFNAQYRNRLASIPLEDIYDMGLDSQFSSIIPGKAKFEPELYVNAKSFEDLSTSLPQNDEMQLRFY